MCVFLKFICIYFFLYYRGPCVRKLFTGLIMYLPSQNKEHCIVFCKYYTNIGPNLAIAIPTVNSTYCSFFDAKTIFAGPRLSWSQLGVMLETEPKSFSSYEWLPLFFKLLKFPDVSLHL